MYQLHGNVTSSTLGSKTSEPERRGSNKEMGSDLGSLSSEVAALIRDEKREALAAIIGALVHTELALRALLFRVAMLASFTFGTPYHHSSTFLFSVG